MNKLLIVDDEPLIQVGIKSMLPWKDYQIEICGTAANGKQALEVIEQTHPDLVIADIKMPIMDGLTLLKTCKETYGDLPLFIMLTSHEEFPLLKEAIKYDIIDYLVKLELTPEVLLTSIQKAQKILAEKKEKAPTSTSSNLSFYYDKFFISLLHNLFESKMQFDELAHFLGLNFSATHYRVAYCSFCNEPASTEHNTLLITSYISSLEMLEELLPKYMPCHIFSLGMNYFCIIFMLETPQSDTTTMTHALNATFSMLHNYFNVSLKASIGRNVTEPLKIAESYQDARQIHPLLTQDQTLLFFDTLSSGQIPSSSNTFNLSLFKGAICKAFEEYDAPMLHETLTTIINLFTDHPTKYLQAIDGACNILYLSLSLLSNGEEIISKIFEDDIDSYRSIYRQNTLEQVMHWLERLRDGLCDTFTQMQKNHTHKIVSQVKKYVDEHIVEKLTLPDVATVFNISPNYLSLLFKKYSDIGFSEYISQKKIAYAKERLAEGRMKIYEIADELGFESAFYFSKVFKKIEGCSPRDYKQYK